jgi:triacylglycerol lipase
MSALKPAIDVERRVEPETVPLLEHLARWDTTSIETIRASYAAVSPPRSRPDPRVTRCDAMISGTNGEPDVHVRWYRPVGVTRPLPCLIYFHGGAYIMGTLEDNDDRLDQLVIELGCAAVSVNWRLAPEHPYPEGLRDGEAVWRAITKDPTAFSVDPDRLVLGGASAGAGLAAALCLRLRELRLEQPILQLLVYPMLDDRLQTRSMRASENPGHWGLWELRAEELSWQAYLGPLYGGDAPETAAPGRATDLSGLAPAFMSIGDVDSYLDSNLAYAALLSNSGVPTELHVYPGVIHGGFLARPPTPRTRQFLRDVYQALHFAFDADPPAFG